MFDVAMLGWTAMSNFDPDVHHRRSIRITAFDYSSPGTYFSTLCTLNRQKLFGDIVDSTMTLSLIGRIVEESWRWLAEQYPFVELGPYVVMPNHQHGIIVLTAEMGGSRTAPTGAPRRIKSIGGLIGAFKTVSTKRVNEFAATPGALLWQRNYWEHVVRNEQSYRRICNYIQNNPATWESDQLNIATARGV